MLFDKYTMYSTTRFNKKIELMREDLIAAYAYKLQVEPCHSFDFAGGFEIGIPIEGSNQHFVVVADVVKNVIWIYIEKEELVDHLPFGVLRDTMINIYAATKEYLKEHRKVDKVLCELV